MANNFQTGSGRMKLLIEYENIAYKVLASVE
jgi:hypothetical protein